jgi:glycosyltransferase involved in cell wall biosynthesis
MKILYATYKHNPLSLNAGSGADFQFYSALLRQGSHVEVIGPLITPAHILERGFRKLYKKVSGSRYAKFPISTTIKTSRKLNKEIVLHQPDVVFSLYPAPFVFLNTTTPLIFRLDTTFLGQQEDWPIYGELGLKISVWQEKRVFERCSAIITMSDWSRNIMLQCYGVPEEKIHVFPNPDAFPEPFVDYSGDITSDKTLERELSLLLVGRQYIRKGVDKAIDITRQLNEKGIKTRLIVCGIDGKSQKYVHFAGFFNKKKPGEFKAYKKLYKNAHFLLHPAIFDASPIVTSEAAAYATPTITNDTGGLATSVKHMVSGIVLPKHSQPKDYVQAIEETISYPEKYYELCRTTRLRYERELNWQVASNTLAEIVQSVANSK